jgi:hypothetical protein
MRVLFARHHVRVYRFVCASSAMRRWPRT